MVLLVNVVAVLAMPPALVFLFMLANDREVMGDLVSPRWANTLATSVVVFLTLAGLLYGKTRLYFRVSDLQKKPRSIVTMADPATGLSHVYEGVSVEQLVPSGELNHESETLEVSSEHKQKVTILCRNVDFQTLPIVAGTVDGKNLTGYVPYYFVVRRVRALQVPSRM